MDKKELKKPDEFVSWGTHAARYAADNAVVVVGGAILVVALIASFFGWMHRRDARELEAAGALYSAEKLLKPQEQQPFPGMRIPGLNEPKKEDVLTAIGKLDEVAVAYPGTKAALRAKAKAGDAYVQLEQWEDAVKSYEAAIGGSAVDRAYALNGAAHARERLGKYEDAAVTYRRLADDPEGFGRDLAALDLARVLEKGGNKSAAIQILSKFPTDYPDSTMKSDAERRLSALGGSPVATATTSTSGAGGT